MKNMSGNNQESNAYGPPKPKKNRRINGLNPDYHNFVRLMPNEKSNNPSSPQTSIDYYFESANKQKAINGRDGLTGCFNKAWLNFYQEHIFNPEEDTEKLAIIFLDINDLKIFNDCFGHPKTDQLITELINLIKGYLRTDDIIIRFGGDEFVILCHKKTNDGENFLKTLEERFKQIQQQILLINEEKAANASPPKLNFSFGIAVYNQQIDQKDLKKTIERADAKMYLDKRSKKIANPRAEAKNISDIIRGAFE